ncbi:transmembrane protein 238-like [Eublepharis macularius]|uniref:Transmembrane protein 238-like n=1 Tax=Eublepharis macularius TaxID=481883 RepID=A0AA97LCI9_EUBMA|nr:transmembrane protein 238-like [Eublepharis macularius]XP_054850773.1 transmembrane protein 238-like [Eublepharis macularius]
MPAAACPGPADPKGGRLGRCAASFWLALAFDAVGLSALLSGVFADVAFADLLIYGGGIGVFLSLAWWVFWYVGNLEVPPAELQDDVGLRPPPARPDGGRGAVSVRVRAFSRRLSAALCRPQGSAAGGRVVCSAAALELELQPV